MGIEKIKTALKKGRSICVTGPAGTGKSYNVNLLCEAIDNGEFPHIRNYHKLATTGLAAMNIKGVTLNSFFGIGIQSHPLYAEKMEESDKWRFIKGKIRKVDLLIIDEVSMLRPDTFELIHEVARRACGNDKFFGGIQIVFVGDFLQLPPVVKEEEAEEIGCQWIFEHPLWQENVDTVMLNKVYRQSDSKTVDALNAIRMGECPDWVNDLMRSREGVTLDHTPLEIVSTNKQAEKINSEKLYQVDAESIFYKAKVKADNNYMVDTIKKQVNADEVLELRKGARVMCLVNLNGCQTVNGSIGTIKDFTTPDDDSKPMPIVEFDNGETHTFELHTWDIGKGEIAWNQEKGKRTFQYKIVASFCQLPLKLAYAITIHKSQGMTLDAVSIDCERIFAGGQAYVALSRVKAIEGLKLAGWRKEYVHADPSAVSFYKHNGQELENAG